MTDLADIYEAYRSDPRFDHLREEGIVLVPGEGSSRPEILIVGEAPGATENTLRRPFMGASGQVLRSLIEDAAELRPEQYFITNTVKYRPHGNRTPSWGEVEASLPYLRQEYAALGSPRLIVAVGGTAYTALRPDGEMEGIMVAAGEWLTISPKTSLVPMIHPAYGLRNRKIRPLLEQQWIEFGKRVRSHA